MRQRLTQILIIVAASTLFLACGEQDVDKIGEAQECLDSATAETAASCEDLVSGLESEKAYMVRCSVAFLKQGFDDPSKFEEIFSALSPSEDSSGSSNPMLSAMAVLAFDTTENAADAQTKCDQSGSPGFIMLASMSNMATTIAGSGTGDLLDTISSGGEVTPEQLEDALSNLDTSDDESLGQSANLIADSYCSDSATADSDVCDDINQATSDDDTDAETGAKVSCLLEFDYTTELLADSLPPTVDASNECRWRECRVTLEVPGATACSS